MPADMKIASMVDTTLLRRILFVIRLAHFVTVVPSYDILLPLTVMQTRWFSALLGLMDTTIHPYFTLLPAGTAERWMKKIVFFPLKRFPTPCASIQI